METPQGPHVTTMQWQAMQGTILIRIAHVEDLPHRMDHLQTENFALGKAREKTPRFPW